MIILLKYKYVEEKNKIERDEAAYRLVSLLYFILVINN
ncbi:conserved hypothetical protein [Peptoniphilus harei ACS-146-V-Sch2b]|uniref:Uncharacterized protein n=1 Tax=Peptoniphilus harei ACS-146-V-Sch2b TaxID=908338 RepID=E4KZW7_9FIRM|nr:conserved hypothetical protein [Peptoniphilus harei ACS-146-V-Sch2b]